MMFRSGSASALVVLDWWLHGSGCLLTAGIAAGAWTAVDQFVNGRIERIDRRHAATSTFMTTAPEIEQEHRLLQAEVADRSIRFEELLGRIPPEVRESEFLAQIDELAKKCELTIRDYRPGSIASQTRHSELEIQLSAEGNYAALCQFLAGIHALPRMSRVTALQVAAASEPAAETYPIEMTLRIYFAQLHAAQ